MRLKSFHVGPYRNIINSGEIPAQEDVTVLVGKNESGKSNLLNALHSLKPRPATRDMPRLDYPRWLQKEHQRSGQYDDARPIIATFMLDDDDRRTVAERFGPRVLRSSEFTVFRRYESTSYTYYRPEVDEKAAVVALVEGADLPQADSLSQLREQLDVVKNETADDGTATTKATMAQRVLARVEEVYGDESVQSAVGKLLNERLPSFF